MQYVILQYTEVADFLQSDKTQHQTTSTKL